MSKHTAWFDDAPEESCVLEADNVRQAAEQFARDNDCIYDESNVIVENEIDKQFEVTIEPHVEFDLTVQRHKPERFVLTLAHVDHAKLFMVSCLYRVASINAEDGTITFEKML